MAESEHELERTKYFERQREAFILGQMASLMAELDAGAILIGIVPLDSTDTTKGIIGVRGAGEVRDPRNVVTLCSDHRQELIGLSQLTIELQNQFFIMLKRNSKELLSELAKNSRKEQLASIHERKAAELEAKQKEHEQTCAGSQTGANSTCDAEDH